MADLVRFWHEDECHSSAMKAMNKAVGGDGWDRDEDDDGWFCDVTEPQAESLALICEKYGVSYIVGYDDDSEIECVYEPMTLRHWAGLRKATVFRDTFRQDSGLRRIYCCEYDNGTFLIQYGPFACNPIDAMEMAKAQDEKRRARK